jgi:branched-chain amino acid transport system substrate-binding protein
MSAASGPIRIGEINTYSPSALSDFMVTYRNGVTLCVEQVNAGGGVLGRRLEVVYRDDELSTATAAREAEALLSKDGVDLIAGTFTSDVGLAVAEVADRLKRVFVATEPRTDALVWERGSRYVFRIRTSQYMMMSMLASSAKDLPARWTILSPNYEGGYMMARVARELLRKARPDIVFAPDQHFKLGALDAATMDSLVATRPEVVLSVAYGRDLLPFVRMGRERGLFESAQIVSPLGDPEYLLTTGAETPAGWLVLGYPGERDDRPLHLAFIRAYRERFQGEPDAAALVGYMGFQAIAAGIARAGALDSESLIRGFEGLTYDSPVGSVHIRASDHQATVGNWVARTAVEDGRPVLVDAEFLDGADYLPDEDTARALRPTRARG